MIKQFDAFILIQRKNKKWRLVYQNAMNFALGVILIYEINTQ